ncbi:hypothetical protein [Methylobacterium sp. Leaf91]|nr:hypothetical protein [Methylobacterium sp. Leaf91]
MTWVTRAVTAPAKIAPHDTWFSRTVRVSAAAIGDAGMLEEEDT